MKNLPSSYRFLLFSRKLSSFSLSQSHLKLKKICSEYSERNIGPIAAALDIEQTFPSKQIKELGTLGLMGILVEKKYGGFDGDTLALSVAVEEIARYCGGTSSILSIHNALYADTINRLGSINQKNNFLLDFANGNKIGGFALSESDSGSDAANLKTTAKKCGTEWILNGTKAWVTNGVEGEAFIVIARSNESGDHKGISAFLVPSNVAGLSRGKKEDKLGIRASSTCNIILDDVRIPNENLLGNEGEGFKIAMSAIDLARIGIASQAIGISEAALNCATQYAGQRIAFGNPIIKLSAVQIRLAKMVTQIEASRLLTWKAAKLRDSGQAFTKNAAMAKLVSSETATFVTHNCIQILGGMGYVKDSPAERYYRDARITEIYAGPTDVQYLVIADNLAKKYGLKIR